MGDPYYFRPTEVDVLTVMPPRLKPSSMDSKVSFEQLVSEMLITDLGNELG